LERRAFPAAQEIIILPASDPGGVLFHDAAAGLQAAGIAATSWYPDTGLLYLRRLPSPAPSRTDCTDQPIWARVMSWSSVSRSTHQLVRPKQHQLVSRPPLQARA